MKKLALFLASFLAVTPAIAQAPAPVTAPISAFPQASTTVDGSEFLLGIQGGLTKKFKLSTLPVSGSILWTQSGVGAVQRTVDARLKDEVFVTDFGVDTTGATGASAKINLAVTAGRRVFFPCGTYLIDAPIFLPSNTDVGGAGACTVLKISATLATDTSAQFGVLRHVFTNNNYTSGNTDIYVHDLSIDNTSGPTTGAHIHALGFYKVTRAGVYNITITSASGKLMDDGTAFVASKEYYVRNNKIYGTINACIDQWEGVTDFDVSGNVCDGLGLANYGILVTGMGTAGAPFTSQRGTIRGNVVNNFPGAGIWLQGGWNGVSGAGSTIGLVKKIEVVGNSVNGVSGYHGIYLSDAKLNTVVGNTIENVGRLGIVVTSENNGLSSENVISDNVVVSCNAAAASSPCINLTGYASYNTLNNNTISGAAQTYSYVINGGATGNIIRGGITPVGTSGDISDGGTGTQIQIGNTSVTTPTFKSLTGYVKANGSSAASASPTVPTTDLSGLGTGVATALGNATNSAGGVYTYGTTLPASMEPAHTGDVTNSAGSLALTLATVNSNVGTFGSATQVPQITVNAKGLATAVANVTVTPAVGSITGLGTGVATALGNATNASGGLLAYGSNVGLHAGIPEAAFRVSQLNLNATGDTAVTITMPQGATRWVLFAVRLSNSTGNLPNGTGTLGLYTGAGRTGTTLVTQQLLNGVITSQSDGTAGNAGTTSTAVGATQSFTASTVYLNVQTAQGATSAIDVAIVLRFF
jgi:parallel beta-helix repeat protein